MQKDAPSERRVAFSSPTDDLAPEFTFSMRLQLLALFATLLTCSTLLAQNTVGTIAYDPALYTEGYTLIYPHNQNRAPAARPRNGGNGEDGFNAGSAGRKRLSARTA